MRTYFYRQGTTRAGPRQAGKADNVLRSAASDTIYAALRGFRR